MIEISIWFLPAIIALGLITSYEDIKEGKIRNKWVILALVYALIVYSGLIIYFCFTAGVNKYYLIELLTNFLFTVSIGFGAWYFGVWTAGDGKLFIAFSALIPLSVYSLGYQKWVPSVILLTNIFIPAFLIMVIFLLFKIKAKNVKKATVTFLKEFFQPKQLFDSIISLFAIFWVIQIFLSSIGMDTYLLRLTLSIIIFSSIKSKLKNKSIYVMLAVSLIRLFIDRSIFSLVFLIDFLILIFVWIFLRSFLSGSLSQLGQEIFAKDVKVQELKQGMILSEVIEQKKKITKQELKDLKKNPGITVIKHQGVFYIKKPKASINLNNFIGEEAEGLTKKQINKIKKIGVKKIKVSQTIPFAPFIFLGVILTIIAKGNILILVKNLI